MSKTLPEYMVPTIYVKLEEMPLTPNGKIDREKLPEPEGNIETEHKYLAPTTEVEKKLVVIWQEVLGVEKIGMHDNFFELGGHSLLATQVISKIRTEFKSELPLKDLFNNKTIRDYASEIETNLYKITTDEIEKISSSLKDIEFSDEYEEIEI